MKNEFEEVPAAKLTQIRQDPITVTTNILRPFRELTIESQFKALKQAYMSLYKVKEIEIWKRIKRSNRIQAELTKEYEAKIHELNNQIEKLSQQVGRLSKTNIK